MHQVHESLAVSFSYNSELRFRLYAPVAILSGGRDVFSFSKWMLVRKNWTHGADLRKQEWSLQLSSMIALGTRTNVARTRNFLARVIPLSTCNKNRFYGNLKNARLLVDETVTGDFAMGFI